MNDMLSSYMLLRRGALNGTLTGDVEGEWSDLFDIVFMTLSLRRRVGPPSFLARERAYRSPQLNTVSANSAPTRKTHILMTHALHKSFLPLGPLRHSGLEVTPQLVHFGTPTGGLPVPLPAPFMVNESFVDLRLPAREEAGTTSSWGTGDPPLAGVVAGGVPLYGTPAGGKGYPAFDSMYDGG